MMVSATLPFPNVDRSLCQLKRTFILLPKDIKLLNEKYIKRHNLLFAQKIKRRRCETDIQVKLFHKISQSITICISKVIIYK